MAKDPLKELNEDVAVREAAMKKEIEQLKQTVSRMSNEQEALRAVAAQSKPISGYIPNEEELRQAWSIAYGESLRSIFQKGLAYWNTKANTLKSELQLAVIRADEAVEAMIEVRKTFMNPVDKELANYGVSSSTNPLVKKV